MAVDILLKLDSIDGESLISGHVDEIDILSWSWGASQTGTFAVGGGGGAGRVDVQDLSITKYVDKASTPLFQACCKGTHVASGKLTLRKAGGDDPLEFYTLDLTDVLITSVSSGGTPHDDRPSESISLNFKQFKITYKKQQDTGSGDGPVEFGWDIAAGAPA